jgi:hypothetical protein
MGKIGAGRTCPLAFAGAFVWRSSTSAEAAEAVRAEQAESATTGAA